VNAGISLLFSPCSFSKLEVEDAHRFEKSPDESHPAKAGQPRLGSVEVAPFVKQMDAIPPAFDFLAAPEAPAQKAPKYEGAYPDFEKFPGIEDQLCNGEMVA
jgi:hypothetical protein